MYEVTHRIYNCQWPNCIHLTIKIFRFTIFFPFDRASSSTAPPLKVKPATFNAPPQSIDSTYLFYLSSLKERKWKKSWSIYRYFFFLFWLGLLTSETCSLKDQFNNFFWKRSLFPFSAINKEDTLVVTVIVVGNGVVYSSSKPECCCLPFTPYVSNYYPKNRKTVWFFSLDMATDLGKGKFWIQTYYRSGEGWVLMLTQNYLMSTTPARPKKLTGPAREISKYFPFQLKQTHTHIHAYTHPCVWVKLIYLKMIYITAVRDVSVSILEGVKNSK